LLTRVFDFRPGKLEDCWNSSNLAPDLVAILIDGRLAPTKLMLILDNYYFTFGKWLFLGLLFTPFFCYLVGLIYYFSSIIEGLLVMLASSKEFVLEILPNV